MDSEDKRSTIIAVVALIAACIMVFASCGGYFAPNGAGVYSAPDSMRRDTTVADTTGGR